VRLEIPMSWRGPALLALHAASLWPVLLSAAGYTVQRAGTAMIWQGQTVLVDAPCSGVKML
jgi:hypothetical protein